MQQLGEKSFSLKLLPDHIKLCLLHRHCQGDQLVALERPPQCVGDLRSGTLRNNQQMPVSRRIAAVWQISPVQRKFAVSKQKERVVKYARHHGQELKQQSQAREEDCSPEAGIRLVGSCRSLKKLTKATGVAA
ncbi:MAG: hypothetical protein MJE68_03620 [Proteobacteria bacterium]|nr:hypothetical protein [Pseudomonadota bacterium]